MPKINASPPAAHHDAQRFMLELRNMPDYLRVYCNSVELNVDGIISAVSFLEDSEWLVEAAFRQLAVGEVIQARLTMFNATGYPIKRWECSLVVKGVPKAILRSDGQNPFVWRIEFEKAPDAH